MSEDNRPRTIDVLIDRVATNPDVLAKIKTDPVDVLTDLGKQIKTQYPAQNATNDKFTYRLAVVVLSAVVVMVVAVVGYQWHAVGSAEIKIPEVLVSIGSTALGALAGLLMPGGGSSK